jgi:uncharacterized protein YceH (UPF0502 family)
MLTLTPIQGRVLGVMIEKAQTVPGQYPITINALTTGCNQKNARDPLTSYTEAQVFNALEALRAHGLVREAQVPGARVPKYRHVAREKLGLANDELCILAELFLRGPQSAAELRANASRMTMIGAERAVEIFDHLAKPVALPGSLPDAEPMTFIRELPRRPGERATRFTQLLAELEEQGDLSESRNEEGNRADRGTDSARQSYDMGSSGSRSSPATSGDAARHSREDVAARVEHIEVQLIELKSMVDRLAVAIERLSG